MTGGQANISATIGETFEAWDGYIQGKNVKLVRPGRILQHWRTNEFAKTEEDSQLEILLEPSGDGTKVTIRHSALPAHGLQYRRGWIDAYFLPMKAYFENKRMRAK